MWFVAKSLETTHKLALTNERKAKRELAPNSAFFGAVTKSIYVSYLLIWPAMHTHSQGRKPILPFPAISFKPMELALARGDKEETILKVS